MDLQSFIKETLLQIQRGIGDATRELHTIPTDKGAIGPLFKDVSQLDANDIDWVEFDVAVTVSEGKSGEKSGKLNVAALSVGGSKTSSSQTQSVSRVKFRVPIIPPRTTITSPVPTSPTVVPAINPILSSPAEQA